MKSEVIQVSVGSRIKELRENKNISRNELANSVGVTVGAISNYENEVSSPKEPILFKIMEVLNCDANYLFQDAIEMPNMNNSVSIQEFHLVEKYRELDEDGKQLIDTVLDFEFKRSINLKEARESQKKRLRTYEELLKNLHGTKSQPLKVAENLTYETNAANKRTDIVTPEGTDTSDDDIMDDENF
nr:MAG TPA: helix-turn-helix domain protein [Caudoviricetes sp.]